MPGYGGILSGLVKGYGDAVIGKEDREYKEKQEKRRQELAYYTQSAEQALARNDTAQAAFWNDKVNATLHPSGKTQSDNPFKNILSRLTGHTLGGQSQPGQQPQQGGAPQPSATPQQPAQPVNPQAAVPSPGGQPPVSTTPVVRPQLTPPLPPRNGQQPAQGQAAAAQPGQRTLPPNLGEAMEQDSARARAAKLQDDLQKQQAELQKAQAMIPIEAERAKAIQAATMAGDIEKATALKRVDALVKSEEFKSEMDQIAKVRGKPWTAAEMDAAAYAKAGIPTPNESKGTEKVDVKGPDGKQQVAFRDPKTGKVFGGDGKEIDMSKGFSVTEKEGAETGELGTRVKAERIIADPKADPIEKKAAQATLKHLDAVEKGTEVRIINQQAAGSAGQGGGMNDEEMGAMAKGDYLTGKTRSFGLGKSKDRDRYNKAQADLYLNDPAIIADRADFKAGSANLQTLERVQGQIGSFENAFQSDLENAREAAAKVPRSQSSSVNSVAQLFSAKATDNPELAEFAVYAQTAINQYSRLVSSASGGGVSTDAARQEAIAILNKNMAKGAFNAALNAMQKEAKNRVSGIQTEIDKQKKRLSGTGQNGFSPLPQKDLPKVASKDQFDKLPKGAHYIGKDGHEYAKP